MPQLLGANETLGSLLPEAVWTSLMDPQYASLEVSLQWDGASLWVHMPPHFRMTPWTLSYNTGTFGRRIQNAANSQEPLRKALGKLSLGARVLDAFGGFGIDAMLMAQWGFSVTSLEFSPATEALRCIALQQCLHSRKYTSRFEDVASLAAICEQWDVIYFDPMFNEERVKGAKTKELVILDLLSKATSESAIQNAFVSALSSTRERLVVKRAAHQDPLVKNPLPNYSIEGPSTRFDVYLSR